MGDPWVSITKREEFGCGITVLMSTQNGLDISGVCLEYLFQRIACWQSFVKISIIDFAIVSRSYAWWLSLLNFSQKWSAQITFNSPSEIPFLNDGQAIKKTCRALSNTTYTTALPSNTSMLSVHGNKFKKHKQKFTQYIFFENFVLFNSIPTAKGNSGKAHYLILTIEILRAPSRSSWLPPLAVR